MRSGQVSEADPGADERAHLFDRHAVRRHRDRAAGRWAPERNGEFLYEEVAGRLLDRLGELRRTFATVLDLGCRRGQLARQLAGRTGTTRVLQADLSPVFAAVAKRENRFLPTLAIDEEWLPFAPGSVDLVTACLCLHWTNDLPGALVQVRQALKPDGLLLAALLGGDTLSELRDALTAAELEVAGGVSPRLSPVADVRDAGALLQRAGFALPVVDRDRLSVTYEHALGLMADLRDMAETNAMATRRRGFTRRETLLRAADIYRERHTDTAGRLMATFDVIYLAGWAPAAQQQRPLRPGSATARLADALDTSEHASVSGQEEPDQSGPTSGRGT